MTFVHAICLCTPAGAACLPAKVGTICCSQGVIPNLFKLAPAAGISWFTFEVMSMLHVGASLPIWW